MPFLWVVMSGCQLLSQGRPIPLPLGAPRVSSLLGFEGGVLIFATWFSIIVCPWKCLALELYLSCVGILWVPDTV